MHKDYHTYQPLDFAQDDSFIRWVKTDDPTASQFWEQWLSDHPDKTAEVEEARVLVRAIKVKESEPSAGQIGSLWNRIEESIAEEQPVKKLAPRRLRIVRWAGYAAAACAAILLIMVLSRPAATLQTDNAEMLVHTLPDGSTVEMNAASKVWFNAEKWEEAREIRLEGEAFFKVEKGASFRVITKAGTVEVLGTSFNVFARNADLEVDCFTGKVRVNNVTDTDSVILTKGQGTRLESPKELESNFPIDTLLRAGWRNGIFDFPDAPLQRVLEEVGRQYDVKISAEKAVEHKVFNFDFEKTEQLDSVLQRMEYVLGLEVEQKGNRIKMVDPTLK